MFKFGLMVQDTMASGEMEWPMVTEDLSMLKEMCMKVNGLKIKRMVLEFTLITTEVDTKDNGTRISNMVMVWNNGQMVQNMRVNMNKV